MAQVNNNYFDFPHLQEHDDEEETNALTDFFNSINEHLDPISATEHLPLNLKSKKIATIQASLESKERWSGVAAFVSAIALIVICCFPPVSVAAAVCVGLFFVASSVVNRLCASSQEAIKDQALDIMEERFKQLKNK